MTFARRERDEHLDDIVLPVLVQIAQKGSHHFVSLSRERRVAAPGKALQECIFQRKKQPAVSRKVVQELALVLRQSPLHPLRKLNHQRRRKARHPICVRVRAHFEDSPQRPIAVEAASNRGFGIGVQVLAQEVPGDDVVAESLVWKADDGNGTVSRPADVF